MSVLITIVSFLVVLAILVFIHELGHFLAARHVGVRVERFSIGLPPRAWGKKVGDTEYMVSWLPLGGYVKLFGQNLDDEDPNDPANYAAKTKLQRIYILLAGPLMNVIAALLIMPMVYMVGEQVPAYRYSQPILAEVAAGTPADAAGFRPGDAILAIEGQTVESWKRMYEHLEVVAPARETLRFTVRRDGGTQEVSLPTMALASPSPVGWSALIPPVVGQMPADSPASVAGMKVGDRIVRMDGQPIMRWEQVPPLVQASEGNTMQVVVRRGELEVPLEIQPRYSREHKRWLIHIALGSVTEEYGFVDSITMGFQRVANMTSATFSFLWRMLSGQGGLDAVGGPVKIATVVGDAATSGPADLLLMMAFISLQLGIFNLLPLPVLDGGHILMIGMEAVKRGPLSVTFRERTQLVGLSLLLLLVVVVTFNDVMSLLG